MEKIDARKHNQQTQYALRKRLVRLRKRGMKNKEAAEVVGISAAHASANTIWQKYLKGGIEAIKSGKSGRKPGAQRVLDWKQEMIVDKAPKQYKRVFKILCQKLKADI